MPSCPITTLSPISTSCIGLHHARFAARSMTTATSISICSTSTQRPLMRTCVGRLVVEAHVAAFGLVPADIHFLDIKVAAAIHDDVPCAREGPGVNNVAC